MYLMYVFVISCGLCSCFTVLRLLTSQYFPLLPLRDSGCSHFYTGERNCHKPTVNVSKHLLLIAHLAIFSTLMGLSMNGLFMNSLPLIHTHLPYNRELPSKPTLSDHQHYCNSRIVIKRGWGVKMHNLLATCIRTGTPGIFLTAVAVKCISAQVDTTCLEC